MGNQGKCEQKRDSGIDLMKIVSMLMIVVLHILGTGGGMPIPNNTPARYAGELVRIACVGAVNCFAMASGYLMNHRQFKVKNMLSVWLAAVFYMLLFSTAFQIVRPETMGIKQWIKAIFPVTFSQYWYVTAYIVMSAFLPVILPGLEKLSVRQLTKVSGTLLLFTSVLSMLNDMCYLNSGYSALWLMVMFIIGYTVARLREAGHRFKYRWISLAAYFLCVGLTFGGTVILQGSLGEWLGVGSYWLAAYNSPTVVLASVFLFCYLTSLSIKKKRVIGALEMLGSLTLGVYLIHTNPLVWTYVLTGAFAWLQQFQAQYIYIYIYILVLGAGALAIFAVCTMVEYIRKTVFSICKLEGRVLSLLQCVKKCVLKKNK